MTDFRNRVSAVVSRIPKGQVMTYAEVAAAAGNPRAARAVANIMAKNYDPDIPCHRVICSNGRPGGYNRGGESAKYSLLASEGVVLLKYHVQL